MRQGRSEEWTAEDPPHGVCSGSLTETEIVKMLRNVVYACMV
jgi:hypothetical protein